MNSTVSHTWATLLIACSTVIAPLAYSQVAAPSAPAQRAQQGPGLRPMAQQMMAELNLTDAQKAQLTPILEAQRTKMSAIFNDTTLSREQKAAKMQSLRAAVEPELSKILTPEQLQKWNAKRNQMRARFQNKMNPAKKPATTP